MSDLGKAKSAIEILSDAKALIEKGWVKQSFHEDGCYCPLGAIGASAGVGMESLSLAAVNYLGSLEPLPELHSAVSAIINELPSMYKKRGQDGSWCIAEWNDKLSRRKSDVVKLFDRAIKTLKTAEAETV